MEPNEPTDDAGTPDPQVRILLKIDVFRYDLKAIDRLPEMIEDYYFCNLALVMNDVSKSELDELIGYLEDEEICGGLFDKNLVPDLKKLQEVNKDLKAHELISETAVQGQTRLTDFIELI